MRNKGAVGYNASVFIFHNSSHSVYLSHKQTFSDRLKQPTELIVCMVVAAALNSRNLQNLIKYLYPCLDMLSDRN